MWENNLGKNNEIKQHIPMHIWQRFIRMKNQTCKIQIFICLYTCLAEITNYANFSIYAKY